MRKPNLMKGLATATLLFTLLGLLVFPHAAYTVESAPQDLSTKHYKESLFKVTEKGIFSIELVVQNKELQTGINSFDIIIHDKAGRDVVGAEITVVPWMPAHGHGVNEIPVITERGGGLYSAGNVMLIMAGHWELRIMAKKDAVEDQAVFSFPRVMAGGTEHHQEMQPTGQPDRDTSPIRMSEKGLFKVSHESPAGTIPLNRIHTWRLKVETRNGEPVAGAQITVNGDMPEHGHGLPTRPEVLKEPEAGSYLVEGMKFNMPGWWVVSFSIKNADTEDSVVFNLMLQ